MVDSDAVKRLLEGNIEPSEIESSPALYSMAERIYGREALEIAVALRESYKLDGQRIKLPLYDRSLSIEQG